MQVQISKLICKRNGYIESLFFNLAHLVIGCYILAAYRVLCSCDFDHDTAIEIISRSANLHEWIMTIFNLPRISSSDNLLRSMSDTWGKISRLRGPGFVFEIQQDNMQKPVILNVKIKKCQFADFFRKNGASSLTFMFCNAEFKIFEGLDPQKHNVRFWSPEQIADGSPACKFKYRRMNRLQDFEPIVT